MQWTRYEDGHQQLGSTCFLREPSTEEDAKKAMADMQRFYELSREDLVQLSKCFAATDDDLDYIENRYPNYQSRPTGPGAIDTADAYEARLRALAGLHPKTVSLIRQAESVADPAQRETLERRAVQAYFAELAHYWTDEQVLAWQRNNPIGTEWMREFVSVLGKPAQEIDRVLYELAFNWLRLKYNLLTAKELAIAIFEATKEKILPDTLKKKRDHLGLTGKRPPGPRPREGQ